MAKIVLSDLAPKDAKRFTLGAAEVEVPFETDDTDVLSNARVHPWLVVESDQTPSEAPPSYVNHLAPEDDVLSAVNSKANDPEEVRKALEAREDVLVQRVAIDADLDQNKKVETAGVAVTVAAADDEEPAPVKTKTQPTTGPTRAVAASADDAKKKE